MGLLDAVIATGPVPDDSASRAEKKRYSEILSQHLAYKVAEGLRSVGFPKVRPEPEGPGEKAFQGGLGPKKVDVSYADEKHGLILAVSVKSINFAPFGKNLMNRFSDLTTESITLHLRFPYSVICAFFAMPNAADQDLTAQRTESTFSRATKLFSTISGREEYTDPGEKFENVTMMLFQPITKMDSSSSIRLINTNLGEEIDERDYFRLLLDIHNVRNPHATIDAA